MVYTAAHDDRVKCVVSQVGGMDSRSSSLPWTKTEAMQKEVRQDAVKRAEHGQRLYALVKDRIPAEYWLFSGTHFEIYNQGRREAVQRAIAWYGRYLK